jgi:hypothetical protein
MFNHAFWFTHGTVLNPWKWFAKTPCSISSYGSLGMIAQSLTLAAQGTCSIICLGFLALRAQSNYMDHQLFMLYQENGFDQFGCTIVIIGSLLFYARSNSLDRSRHLFNQ